MMQKPEHAKYRIVGSADLLHNSPDLIKNTKVQRFIFVFRWRRHSTVSKYTTICWMDDSMRMTVQVLCTSMGTRSQKKSLHCHYHCVTQSVVGTSRGNSSGPQQQAIHHVVADRCVHGVLLVLCLLAERPVPDRSCPGTGGLPGGRNQHG